MVVGGPIMKLNYNSGRVANLFLNVTFPRSGRVTHWGYYAISLGEVVAAVWRPKPNNMYMLVGKNKLNTSKTGENVSLCIVLISFVLQLINMLGLFACTCVLLKSFFFSI